MTSQKIASLILLQWEQKHLNLTPISLILSSIERLTSLFLRRLWDWDCYNGSKTISILHPSVWDWAVGLILREWPLRGVWDCEIEIVAIGAKQSQSKTVSFILRECEIVILRFLQWEQNNLNLATFCMRLSSRVYIKWRVPSQIDILYWFISREWPLSLGECEIVRLRLLQWEQNSGQGIFGRGI